MTPKQAERIKTKITKIKRALATDKRRHGGYYDDSGGLRYLPPELYLKLKDYSGALRYFNWFHKNFPDDIGYPIFLFEWTVTLFKTKRLKEAEMMARKTFSSNTYLLDGFLGNQFAKLDEVSYSNWQSADLLEYFKYSKQQEELEDFAEWLTNLIDTPDFAQFIQRSYELDGILKTEPVGPKRSKLIKERYGFKS